ncbi:MAG: metallophosphoesterase [Micropruina sp.]|uniref:metallophosphoesterase n=1 Tax=Micropruina sp. TaxID=2737536 RepID=UPI0039E2B15E
MTSLRRILASASSLALVGTITTAGSPAAQAITMVDCAALSEPVYSSVNPSTGATLLTRWESEAVNAAKYGFTDFRGEVFKASQYATPSMVAVHRLAKGGDFAHEADPDRIADLVRAGYEDQGVRFYASKQSDWCTRPVQVAQHGSVHRYSVDLSGEQSSALDWKAGPVVYHVAAAPTRYGKPTEAALRTSDSSTKDKKFSFAVIPDTQPEVWRSGDPRFTNRSQWLVANKSKYDIRWAIQTGDLVDWDDATHSHYENAKAGLAPLQGKLPYFLNIGNHDAAATCYGGSACDGRFVRPMVRITRTFNQYFSVQDYSAPTGSFEPGKVDNTYARFKAGNKYWLILNLELWPRREVVEWARSLVAKHANHNVIIATHSFLSSSGSISSSAEYGSTSPRYLWDTIIKKYSNVKVVLSGHTGSARTEVLTGAKGNKVYAFLTTYHSKTTNPVRMIEVDASKKTIRTWVEAPYTKDRLMSTKTYSKVKLT